jgi:hypothetical protein
MSKRFTAFLFAAVVLSTWLPTNLVAETKSSKEPTVVEKTNGHPQKSTSTVAVHQTAKPKPAAKVEKVPKALHENSSWVPGDYYWNGLDWQWADGYWQDNAWTDVTWIPGHWSDRWWGYTWVPGYWF